MLEVLGSDILGSRDILDFLVSMPTDDKMLSTLSINVVSFGAQHALETTTQRKFRVSSVSFCEQTGSASRAKRV